MVRTISFVILLLYSCKETFSNVWLHEHRQEGNGRSSILSARLPARSLPSVVLWVHVSRSRLARHRSVVEGGKLALEAGKPKNHHPAVLILPMTVENTRSQYGKRRRRNREGEIKSGTPRMQIRSRVHRRGRCEGMTWPVGLHACISCDGTACSCGFEF